MVHQSVQMRIFGLICFYGIFTISKGGIITRGRIIDGNVGQQEILHEEVHDLARELGFEGVLA